MRIARGVHLKLVQTRKQIYQFDRFFKGVKNERPAFADKVTN